jgi:serine/threonine-protein kinase HipA
MEDRLRGSVITHGLTSWFEHLLPQGPLRGAVARDAGLALSDGLGLLAWLGSDLPGAVTVEVVRALRQRPRTPLALATTTYKASIAGAQWKLSLSALEKGLTLPLRGGDGDVIAKFHAEAHPGITRVEHATMTWAARSGVDVPPHRVARCDDIAGLPEEIPRGDGDVFVIDRFDRSSSGRVHVEDFGQVFDRPPGHPWQYTGSHEEIAAVIAALCPADRREYLRRVVFCCVVGNGDAHLKNWALRYEDGRHARLSPAYDLVPTVIYARSDDLALSLGGTRDFGALTPGHFDRIAEVVGCPRGDVRQWVIDDARLIRAHWEQGVREMFTEPQRVRIERHFERVQGLWGALPG